MTNHEIILCREVSCDELEYWVKAVLIVKGIELPKCVIVKTPSADYLFTMLG